MKLRLGEFLRSKNHQAQKSELLMKFIVHNITCLVAEIYESDIHIDFRNAMNKVMGCGLSVTK